MAEIVVGRLQVLTTMLGDANNSVLLTLGDVQNGDTEAAFAQLFQHYGFCSLPPNAAPGKAACETVVIRGESNYDTVISTRDVSSQKVYANMSPGDTIMYSAGPDGNTKTRVKMNGELRTVTLMTSDDNNNDIQFSISPTALSFFSPWGKIIFDATGFHITHISGAEFHLSSLNFSIAGIGLSSSIRLKADHINCMGLTQVGNGTTYFAPVLAPVPSLTPLTPSTVPCVTPITGLGVTSTNFIVAA